MDSQSHMTGLDMDFYYFKMSTHICFLAGNKAEALKDLHHGQLHHQESKSHADAIPRPRSEG